MVRPAAAPNFSSDMMLQPTGICEHHTSIGQPLDSEAAEYKKAVPLPLFFGSCCKLSVASATQADWTSSCQPFWACVQPENMPAELNVLHECKHPAGLDPEPLWEQEEHRGFEEALKSAWHFIVSVASANF